MGSFAMARGTVFPMTNFPNYACASSSHDDNLYVVQGTEILFWKHTDTAMFEWMEEGQYFPHT